MSECVPMKSTDISFPWMFGSVIASFPHSFSQKFNDTMNPTQPLNFYQISILKICEIESFINLLILHKEQIIPESFICIKSIVLIESSFSLYVITDCKLEEIIQLKSDKEASSTTYYGVNRNTNVLYADSLSGCIEI